MARTLIGQLILRLQTQGLGEAQKVKTAMSDIEAAAKRLGSSGTRSWGIGFQRQLDGLKLTKEQIGEVQQSWASLHDSIKNRGLDKALKGAEISHWRTNTLSSLAQVQGDYDRHFKEIERKTKQHATLMKDAMKPVFVGLGFYTAAYGAGMMGTEGLRAASAEHRARADAKFAGLSEGERGKIETRSDELATKYRLPKSVLMDMIKDSALNMPSTDAAIDVADAKARALLVLASQPGATAEGSVDGLRRFDKAMDNIERVEPDEYRKMLEGFIKMQQVVGPDMDPSQYEQAIKYSRTAGKVHGDEFLTQYLPLMLSAVGGSNAGTQTRSFFDQFLVGRAPKAALAEQERYGIRKDGKLIGQDAFGENPVTWIYDYLLPQLKKAGVDTEDNTELARVIGELTNNRNSSDMISSAIISMEQWTRILEERLPNAYGLKAADEVQNLNPFAAWDGFKASLENLSGALLPMNEINTGLNALADGINKLAAASRDNPLLAALGIGGAGAGIYAGGKKVGGLLSDAFGLKGSAVALDGSAAALTRAAVALGGSGVADVPGSPKGKPGGGMPLLTITPLVSAAITQGSTRDNPYANASPDERQAMRDRAIAEAESYYRPSHSEERERDFSGSSYMAPAPGGPGGPGGIHAATMGSGTIDSMLAGMDRLRSEAASAGQEVQQSLSVTATPVINTSPLAQAIAMARQFLSIINQANAAAASAEVNVRQELRRNFTD